ncbi:hypothetical protein PhCBS80983_g01787 [Powellomyces hirtus]|uniref:EXS domain-containing protein n=1 Tax=Powellomyces hirtus TaxID=109895 RepID=A0A507E935_9FUNG|nr:hypothetical protein PhCBS80983_g01787 [Powellomyces hirtus]
MSAATKSVSSVKEALVAIDIALKILEVLRRWMWVFLRVEREWVSRPSYAARGAHHLASGDAMSPMIDPPDLGWDRLRESTMLSSKLTR